MGVFMKDMFSYIAIFSLALLSFYYTNEVVMFMNNKTMNVVDEVNKDNKYIVIDINNSDIESIYSIFKDKKEFVSFSIGDKVLENKRSFIEKIILEGNNVFYKGNSEKAIKEYISMMNYLGVKPKCISIHKDNGKLCNDFKIESIKYNNYISKNALFNIKDNVNKEDYFVIKDTLDNINEIGVIINFINNKGYLMKAR